MNYVIFMDDAVHINCVISMEYSRKTPQKPIKSYKAQLKIKELKHNINNKHLKDSQDAADKVHIHACLSLLYDSVPHWKIPDLQIINYESTFIRGTT